MIKCHWLQHYKLKSLGCRSESDYPGIFQWNRLKSAEITANPNVEALSFHNWDGAPAGTGGCVVMNAGATDPKNGRWSVVDCSTTSTLYGICEYSPENV